MRILDPQDHIFRRIAEEAGDVGPCAHMQPRRPNVSGCVDDTRDQMVTARQQGIIDNVRGFTQ